LRNLPDRLFEGAGAIAALAFFGLQFFLFVGGISYRKDCLSDEGRVKSSWTFQVFAPVPYLFRPSEDGCQVHTGTRVALNSIGIATFAQPTTTSLADHAVEGANGLSEGDAYFARVKARLVEYQRAPQARDIAQATRTLDQALSSIQALTPPASYASVHEKLVSSLRDGRRGLDSAAKAHATPETADDERVLATLQRADEQLSAAVADVNRIHESSR
jgi:hypothetical protein